MCVCNEVDFKFSKNLCIGRFMWIKKDSFDMLDLVDSFIYWYFIDIEVYNYMGIYMYSKFFC